MSRTAELLLMGLLVVLTAGVVLQYQNHQLLQDLLVELRAERRATPSTALGPSAPNDSSSPGRPVPKREAAQSGKAGSEASAGPEQSRNEGAAGQAVGERDNPTDPASAAETKPAPSAAPTGSGDGGTESPNDNSSADAESGDRWRMPRPIEPRSAEAAALPNALGAGLGRAGGGFPARAEAGGADRKQDGSAEPNSSMEADQRTAASESGRGNRRQKAKEDRAAQAWSDHGQRIRSLLKDLLAGSYEQVTDRFDPTMAENLSARQLARAIDPLRSEHGGLKRIVGHRLISGGLSGGAHTFEVETEHEDGHRTTFTVTLDRQDHVSGLLMN